MYDATVLHDVQVSLLHDSDYYAVITAPHLQVNLDIGLLGI